MVNVEIYSKTVNCSKYNNFPCICNTSQQNDLLNPATISNSAKEDIEIFPPFSSDISNRSDVKPAQVLSNLEVVRDLEFHHEFISEQIEKFSITPILCNCYNDLLKHFLHPSFYTNELYIHNSKWVLNSNSHLLLICILIMSPFSDI